MADVEEIRERLAMIQRTIEGVKRAYEYAPQSLPPSDLPAFVNFVGPSMENWQALGSNYDQEGRTFIMRLFVKGVQQGVDGEAEKACEPFLERVRDAFSGRPGLGLGHSSGSAGRPLDGVMGAYLAGDSGISPMLYAGEEFLGTEFRLHVQQVVGVTYVE